jgi:hypothetical protein
VIKGKDIAIRKRSMQRYGDKKRSMQRYGDEKVIKGRGMAIRKRSKAMER